MAVAAAVITGIGVLLGAGISAVGASESAKAQEEEEKKKRALSAKQFKEQMQATRREQNLKGLDFLAGQRDKMTMYSRTKSYNNPLRNNFRDRLLNMAGGG